MNLWSVFLTSLLAGGASCAMVQGGLLAGTVARREQGHSESRRSQVDDVLIPCGVTLSIMVLAVASGSPVVGAAGMAVLGIGTSPLFAVLGYTVRRSGTMLRGYLGKAAAVAVMVAGLLSINSGLTVTDPALTLERAWEGLTGGGARAAAPGPGQDAAVTVDGAGVQQIAIAVGDDSYSPARAQARAGVPTRLILRTNGTQGCTRGFVIPAAGFETALPKPATRFSSLGNCAPAASTTRARWACTGA